MDESNDGDPDKYKAITKINTIFIPDEKHSWEPNPQTLIKE